MDVGDEEGITDGIDVGIDGITDGIDVGDEGIKVGIDVGVDGIKIGTDVGTTMKGQQRKTVTIRKERISTA